MTAVYSLGIFLVMLPIVLGAKMMADFFFDYHNQVYVVGGILMLASAVFSLLGIKLPMPHFKTATRGQADVISTFLLGVIAGITSACCAPVLVGVITISSLSPSLIQALLIGVVYVLGMVTPLYLAALFVERGNFLSKPIFRKRVFTIKFYGSFYPVLATNLLAASLFFIVGTITLSLVFTGRLSMPTEPPAIVNSVAWAVTKWSDKFPITNVLFGLSLVFIVYWVAKKIRSN